MVDAGNRKIEGVSRTELDSHAASIVVGKNALITHDSGKSVNVGPFTEQLGKLNDVPIVDCVIAHDCPYSKRTILLAMYNALYIPEMSENLVPPFVLRRQGNVVNDIPKIQIDAPTELDHCLILDDNRVHIPLQLIGTMSYFQTRKPSMDEYEEAVLSNQLVDLNVNEAEWDPLDPSFARDEAGMLDFEGRLIEGPARSKDFFDVDTSSDQSYDLSKVNVLREDEKLVARISALSVNDGAVQRPPDNKHMANWEQQEMKAVSRSLDPVSFASDIVERTAISKFQSSMKSKVSAVSVGGNIGIKAEDLAKVFRVDLKTAKQTLLNTTQYLKRSKNPSLHRRYSSNDRMLRYTHLREYFYMDTMFASQKSGATTRGNTCLQLFVTDKGFVFVCPMKRKSDVPFALKLFFKKVGVPDAIICDQGGEQIGGDSKKLLRESGTVVKQIEPNTPWSNRAERYIGIFKQAVRDLMHETNCPMKLWDYCMEYKAKVNNSTARNLYQLGSLTPYQTIYQREPDISNLCQFKFYDWCYYREETAKFPFPSQVLGRVLGPSDGVGNEMAVWIIRVDGRIISRQTARPLTDDEVNSPLEIARRKAFDEAIKRKLGDSIHLPEKSNEASEWLYLGDVGDGLEIPDTDNESYDLLVNSEVILPHQDRHQHAVVLGRHKKDDGTEIGRTDHNPALNTAVYDVKFPDGAIKQYSANIIAENLYSQVDMDGHTSLVLESIVDHRKDETAIKNEDKYFRTKQGQRRLRQTTKGWELCVLWRNGEEQWVPLRELKQSNPVEVADYAHSNNLIEEPAFKWWVPYTLRKRDYIVSKVTSRVTKRTHKYGVRIPRSIKEAYELDKSNNNSLWRDAIEKEMQNVSIAFEVMEDDEVLPKGYKPASCHIIFDVKMDFTRKARYVMDGHRTPDPDGSTYAGVVSRESIRIALTYAALNDLNICAGDILNAYLQAPSSEKYYIPKCGVEFGLENVGKRAKIVRALYGGKSSGRDFRNHLRSCMSHLGFQSCKADPDVWMREATKCDGTSYYQYVLLYVDDVLVVAEGAEQIIRNEIGKYFMVKEESIGIPEVYLGGKISEVILNNGARAFTFSSSKYVKGAVSNVEAYLQEKGLKFPSRVSTPLSIGYRPEVDTSDELDDEDAAYYQSLIGVLRWMVELGRIDITCEVSMMASHMALPREGHLAQLFHMFAYLKKCHNSELVFDPSDRDVDYNEFVHQDWDASEYGILSEETPVNAPKPRGMGFTMLAYVDSDHAGEIITRRSRTGYIVYLNNSPIYWISKKQQGVETSSFGAEFTAMKQCTEYIRGLRFKLRMMGIPCSQPSLVYGDNKSVLANASMPDSVLKKKAHSIAYNFVREGVVRKEWLLAYVNTKDNIADFLTKPLSGEQRMKLVRQVLHHL